VGAVSSENHGGTVADWRRSTWDRGDVGEPDVSVRNEREERLMAGLGAPRVAGEEMGQVGGPDLLRRKVFFRNLFNHFQST
jgi:hypothetical protein